MVIFAGQGDARRSMSLLWRTSDDEQVRPGPKPGLTVDEIVEAAISIADEGGVSALSMRAVGERLGRTGMALYTYVPNKSELLDLMYDHAFAELPAHYDTGDGWRAALVTWADDTRAFYLRHPWLLQVSHARPVLGPNEYQVVETALRLGYETGLDAAALRATIGALFHFVRGAAQTISESRQAEAATGVPDREWWAARAAQLPEVAPDFADRYPTMHWLEHDRAGRPPSDYVEENSTAPYLEQAAMESFHIGLTILLDGIDAARVRHG